MLGFAQALSPPHTAFDGDTLFALSIGDVAADVTRLGLAAAEAVAQRHRRAASRAATSRPDLPAAAASRQLDARATRVRLLRRAQRVARVGQPLAQRARLGQPVGAIGEARVGGVAAPAPM